MTDSSQVDATGHLLQFVPFELDEHPNLPFDPDFYVNGGDLILVTHGRTTAYGPVTDIGKLVAFQVHSSVLRHSSRAFDKAMGVIQPGEARYFPIFSPFAMHAFLRFLHVGEPASPRFHGTIGQYAVVLLALRRFKARPYLEHLLREEVLGHMHELTHEAHHAGDRGYVRVLEFLQLAHDLQIAEIWNHVLAMPRQGSWSVLANPFTLSPDVVQAFPGAHSVLLMWTRCYSINFAGKRVLVHYAEGRACVYVENNPDIAYWL